MVDFRGKLIGKGESKVDTKANCSYLANKITLFLGIMPFDWTIFIISQSISVIKLLLRELFKCQNDFE